MIFYFSSFVHDLHNPRPQQLDHDRMAILSLRNKFKKDKFLSKQPACEAAVSSELQLPPIEDAEKSKAASVVESRFLSSKTLAKEVDRVLQSFRALLGGGTAAGDLAQRKASRRKVQNGPRLTRPPMPTTVRTLNMMNSSILQTLKVRKVKLTVGNPALSMRTRRNPCLHPPPKTQRTTRTLRKVAHRLPPQTQMCLPRDPRNPRNKNHPLLQKVPTQPTAQRSSPPSLLGLFVATQTPSGATAKLLLGTCLNERTAVGSVPGKRSGRRSTERMQTTSRSSRNRRHFRWHMRMPVEDGDGDEVDLKQVAVVVMRHHQAMVSEEGEVEMDLRMRMQQVVCLLKFRPSLVPTNTSIPRGRQFWQTSLCILPGRRRSVSEKSRLRPSCLHKGRGLRSANICIVYFSVIINNPARLIRLLSPSFPTKNTCSSLCVAETNRGL